MHDRAAGLPTTRYLSRFPQDCCPTLLGQRRPRARGGDWLREEFGGRRRALMSYFGGSASRVALSKASPIRLRVASPPAGRRDLECLPGRVRHRRGSDLHITLSVTNRMSLSQ
jgi:hypothetical protein